MSTKLHSFIIGLLALPYLVEGRSCYSRNGTLITDIAYQPCSSSGDSACCGTNHDGAGHIGVANDVCDTNGLCQNYEAFDGTNEGVKMWWRQGCTDPTWSSPNCLAEVCDTLDYENDNAPVYSCGSDNWVCGNKRFCSSTSRLFTLAATVGKGAVVSTATSSAASATMSPTSASVTTPAAGGTPTSAPTASTAATPSLPTTSATGTPPLSNIINAPTGLSTGAKAGIGAGVVVLIVLLGVILFLLHKIKKGKKQQEAYGKAELSGQVVNAGGKPEAIVYSREVAHNPAEMADNGPAMQEMYAHQERTELGTAGKAHAHEIGQGSTTAEMDARGRFA